MLAGHSAPGAIPHLGRIHLRTIVAKEGSVNRLLRYYTQSRIHLRTAAAKEGSVSLSLNTQALHSTPVGFIYFLPQRRRAVLAGHSAQALHHIPGGFAY